MSCAVHHGHVAAKQGLRLLLVTLALVSQIALGALVVPDEAVARPRQAIDEISVLCGAHPDRPRPPRQHRANDPAMCPLGVALALPAAVITPAVTLWRAPATTRVAWREPAAARAPPAATRHAGAPRGPPILA